MSVLSILLLVTVGIIVVFEVFIHKLTGNQVLNEQIPLIVMGRFLILMILITTSILLNLEQSMTKQGPSYPLVLFLLQFAIIISYFFFEFGLSNSLSTINFMVLLGHYDVLYLD
jgi:membrane protein